MFARESRRKTNDAARKAEGAKRKAETAYERAREKRLNAMGARARASVLMTMTGVVVDDGC